MGDAFWMVAAAVVEEEMPWMAREVCIGDVCR